MHVGDIIRHHAVNLPGQMALVAGGERLTYQALNGRINRMAHALLRAGIARGDRVAAAGRNSVHYFCLYFATAKMGAILVPMSFWYRADEYRYVLENAEPALLIHEAEFAPVLAEAQALAGLGIPTLVMPAFDRPTEAGSAWEAFLKDTPEHEPEVQPGPDWPHMILYTSGTTGRPKGAVLSHGRTVQDGFNIAVALRIRQTDIFVNFFPPFHVGNWDQQKMFLVAGATVVLVPQFEAGNVLSLVEREKVTVILGVPTMLLALMNHPSLPTTDVSSVRLIYYGAYDPNRVLDRIADHFGAREGSIEMMHHFGLTEAGPFVACCPAERVFEKWGSIGRGIPGVEIAVVGEDGQRVAPGHPGELLVKGPMMSGYWRNEAATADAIVDGWLHTGDVVVTDDEGFMWVVDRKKDMIRSGGHNVYSKEVEDCIAGHQAVADVGVIGLDDPVYEEKVCAIVVLRPGYVASDALAADIVAFVRQRKAGYNTPKNVFFTDALPKNAVGKILKHVLREQYRNQ
jgi:acyl-CoA synthetase (AMP-forming)/AMP-acid ligase II